MRVEVVGDVCIDRIVDSGVSIKAGSPGMFIRRMLGRLPNVNVGIIASYGPDFIPFLKAEKVDIYPLHPNVDQTLVYENNLEGEFRTQKAFNRSSVPVSFSDQYRERLARADLIFAAPLVPKPIEFYKQIMQSKNSGAVVAGIMQGELRDFDEEHNVIEQADPDTKLEEIASSLNLSFASNEDHRRIMNLFRGMVDKNSLLGAFVTQGIEGVIIVGMQPLSDISIGTTPILPKNVANTVGAGDVFAAYAALEYMRSRIKIQAAKAGNIGAGNYIRLGE